MKRQGWAVSAASTLAEARPLLEQQLDVLILDLMLPDGDGSSLLKQVRDHGWQVRVVVMTGTSDSAKLAMVRELKPDSLLFKPIDLDQLLKAVSQTG